MLQPSLETLLRFLRDLEQQRFRSFNLVRCMSNELKILSNELRSIFKEVAKELKNKNVTDRNLDKLVLETLRDKTVKMENLEIRFSDPVDDIYRPEAGRTPYDILCYGKINGKPFRIFINNKFGSLSRSNKNDVTTYNNLLRLYFGIKSQRLSEKAEINRNSVLIDLEKHSNDVQKTVTNGVNDIIEEKLEPLPKPIDIPKKKKNLTEADFLGEITGH